MPAVLTVKCLTADSCSKHTQGIRADPKSLKINGNIPISASRPQFLHWTGHSGLDFSCSARVPETLGGEAW